MAITIGTVTESAVVIDPVTLTTAYTVAAGSNRVLVVAVASGDATIFGGVTGVTWNGSEALTEAKGNAFTPAFSYLITLWYVVNPTVATANVVVSFTGNNSIFACATIIQFDGVAQTGTVDAVSTDGEGTGTTASCSVTTVAADAWIIDCAIGRENITVGAGQTMRTDRLGIGTGTDHSVGVSTVDGKASPGAETMDWTLPSADWLCCAFSMKPAAAAAGTNHPLSGKLKGLLGGKVS